METCLSRYNNMETCLSRYNNNGNMFIKVQQ